MISMTSLGIVILSTLILAFLQLEPGIFALFSHYASGKFPRKKRALLTTFFMLGVETTSACLFICALLLSNFFFLNTSHPKNGFILWVFVGIFLALALASFICYFRPGRNTGSQLFIPRKCADALEHYASSVASRSDAFTLGALSSVLELPFSFPVYLISAFALIELSLEWSPSLLLALLVILAPLLPLLFIRYKYRLDYNLADVLRSRAHDKNFVRFVLCFAYAAIAIFCIVRYFIQTPI